MVITPNQVMLFVREPSVRRAIIVCVASIALALMVLLLYWLPIRHSKQSTTEQVNTLRRVLVSDAEAEQIKNAYTLANKQVTTLHKKLARQSSQSDLVQHIGQLARKHGVRILSETYDKTENKSSYQGLVLNLQIQGRYASTRNFVLAIPSLPSWTVVQEARMVSHRGAGKQVKTSLRLVSYRRAR